MSVQAERERFDLSTAASSPHLEAFRTKGIEVLLLGHPVAKASTEFADLASQLKEALGDEVWDVRVTSRLITSPACNVANEPEIDINLARRMRGTGLPSEPVLEINPQHPLVDRLNRRQDDPRLADWAQALYNQAVLALGARIDDPAAFVTRLNDLLVALTDETA
jgi:molecular chaperone HtpG